MKKWFHLLLILIFLYIQQFQLTYSASVGLRYNLTISLPWVLMNMLLVALPFFVGLVVLKKVKWAVLANTILFTVLGIMNYHVVLFHGSPFLAGDVFSIPTAINVLPEYRIVFDSIVIRLCAIFAVEILLWLLVYQCLDKKKVMGETISRAISMLLCVFSVAIFVLLFLSPWAVFQHSLISWSWTQAMNEYGYGVCFGNSIYTITNFYVEPEGYDAKTIMCEVSDEMQLEEQQKYPDIILILNESLADLNVYLELEESERIFSKMQQIDGLVTGYTVSSLIGGGTNNSEYELLTSNSMQIMNLSAPFTALNMTGHAHIVSYLNALSYTTAGMHCGSATNYNRNTAYADMGFDHVRLGRDAFKFAQSGNRSWLDWDNYTDMIELYEACGDMPRFMYLLTFQNHGGYEQNDPDLDSVSITRDYGEYTDDINEYLTSAEKSVDAFLELIRYFNTSNRNVVIMMMGDHAPAFLADIACGRNLTDQQQEIARRLIPYYVWSNYQIDTGVFPEYASMVDLLPLLLKATDMPLTGYYKTIINLNREVPIRTSTGLYMDASGNIFRNMPDAPYYSLIQNYYYLEYNNLAHEKDYNSEWFTLLEASQEAVK